MNRLAPVPPEEVSPALHTSGPPERWECYKYRIFWVNFRVLRLLVPAIEAFDTLLDIYPVVPAEGMQPRRVGQFPHRTVWF